MNTLMITITTIATGLVLVVTAFYLCGKRMVSNLHRDKVSVEKSEKDFHVAVIRVNQMQPFLASAEWNRLRTLRMITDFVNWCRAKYPVHSVLNAAQAQQLLFKLPVGALLQILVAFPHIMDAQIEKLRLKIQCGMTDCDKARKHQHALAAAFNKKLGTFPYNLINIVGNFRPIEPVESPDWDQEPALQMEAAVDTDARMTDAIESLTPSYASANRTSSPPSRPAAAAPSAKPTRKIAIWLVTVIIFFVLLIVAIAATDESLRGEGAGGDEFGTSHVPTEFDGDEFGHPMFPPGSEF